MTPQELRARIERFADEVITLCGEAPADALRLQLLLQLQRAATSTAANYRAACRAQSRPTFIAKLSIALEEADEAEGWLRRLAHQRQDQGEVVNRLLKEANEITAILNASRRTATTGGRSRRSRR
jgi:four helix bundle protein